MASENKYVKYLNKSVEIVDKPAQGENVSVYVRPGDLVDFKVPGINLEDLNYKLVGGDIVIDIPGQGSFTFVSMALMGYNDTPPNFISSSGKQLSLGDILTEVEDINALPIDSLVSNIDVNIPDNTAKENEEGDATENNPQTSVQVIVQEVESLEENENISELEEENDFEIPPEDAPEVIENDFTSNDDSSASSSDTNDSETEGTTPSLSFDIDIQHVDSNATYSNDGTTRVLNVEGGGGVTYANYYPTTPENVENLNVSEMYKQTDAEVLDYRDITNSTADKVIINADDNTYFTDNTISRTVELTPSAPEGYSIETITFSADSFPDSFSIENATYDAATNTYTLTKDDIDTDTVEGFTVTTSGVIEFTFTVSSQQIDNFAFTIGATAVFDIENIDEENRADFEIPLETELSYQDDYGVNFREISDTSDSGQYMFEPFIGPDGETISSGFVVTTNLNDNIIYGSQTLVNTINGGLANDTITGGQEDDTINANTGNDTITGGLGDDLIDGGEGSDTLDYSSINKANNIGIEANLTNGIVTGDGTDTVSNIENVIGTQDNDTIIGDENVNILQGESGADTLYGLDGDDTLEGGAGNDTLEGGLGDDILRGGENGTAGDTVSYENATGSVIVDLEDTEDNPGLGSASGADGIDTLWNFENVTGSDFNDTIDGNSTKNTVFGLDGNDVINTYEGNDYINAGAGNDTIKAGIGDDYIDGSTGIDTIDFSDVITGSGEIVNLELNEASGGDGLDEIYNVENVIGTRYVDTITGDDLNNYIDGGSSNDTLVGNAGDDTLIGGTGNDSLRGGAGDDTLRGGEGIDTVDYSDVTLGGVSVDLSNTLTQDTKNAGSDTLSGLENLIGSSYSDTIWGSSEDNIIETKDGNDTIYASSGTDSIDGGSGEDLLSFQNSTNNITVDLSNREQQSTGDGDLTLSNIENLEGSNQSDTLTGNSNSNEIYGFDGDDVIDGAAGNDSLYGGAGDDTITGGLGDDIIDGGTNTSVGDTVDYSNSDAVSLTLAETGNTASANVGTQTDTVSNIENILGSEYNDTLGGNSEENSIYGDLGNDTFLASDGNDEFVGGDGNDTIDYSSRTTSVNVTLNESAPTNVSNGAFTDSIYQIENVVGSQVADSIVGDSQSNIIQGREGNDTISGGTGNDFLDGGADVDTVDYSYIDNIITNTDGVSVDLSANRGVDLNTNDRDTLTNFENVIGTQFNDTLYGNSADNTLDGKAGNDILKGGAGDDSFIGGSGIDTVDYSDVTADLNVDLNSLSPSEVAIGQGTDTFDSIEGVIGGSGDDTLIGTNGANSIVGGSGDDTLISSGVTDTTNGDTDYLDGGTNGSGGDWVSFGFTSNDITLDLNSSSTQDTGVGKLVVTNVENIEGGFGDDILTGDESNNSLVGSFGNDSFIGSTGNDTINGGRNSDSHRVNITNPAVTFTIVIGAITFTTSAAAEDTMLDDIVSQFNAANSDGSLGKIIKDGNNLLVQTTQSVSVTNGTDTPSSFIDTVDYSSLTTSSIDVDLTQSNDQVNISDGSTDTLVDIEKIVGTNNDDNILGDSSDNIFIGGAGNDILSGGAGADTIDGGAGNDIINGGAGNDTLNGGIGNDTFISTSGDGIDSIDGGAGNDTVDYSLETANISVTLDGSNTSTVTIDTVANDEIENIENIISGSGNDTLVGDSNNNTLIANAGNDTLTGGAGDDYLDGGNEADNSSGDDWVDYSAASTTGVTVDLTDTTSQNISATEGNDTLLNIEHIKGSNLDDTLIGNDADNTLDGGAGNDTLKGNAGDDSFVGGAGLDTVDYSDVTQDLNVDLGTLTGTQEVAPGQGNDSFDSIEGVIGGSGDDILIGTSEANVLGGSEGDDILKGNGGNDTIDGGAGSDLIDFTDTTSDIVLDLSDTNVQTTSVGDLLVSNVERAQGGSGNDTFTGNTSQNTLLGGEGNDTLFGVANNNVLNGEGGIDTADYSSISTGVGINADLNSGTDDVVTYNLTSTDTLINVENIKGSKNSDTIVGDTTDNVNNIFEGNGSNDTISGGSGNDTIYGNNSTNDTSNGEDSGDTLLGGSGNDTIYGQGGDDTLTGNSGVDTLDGGVGNDTIDYTYLNTSSNGVDVDFITNTANDGTDTDVLNSIENVIGSSNDDSFVMREGTTTNIIDGNNGVDLIDYSNYSTSIDVDLGQTTSQTITTSDNDTILDVENLIATSLDDIVTGSSSNNSIDGGDGSDTFFSSDGDDILNGGVDATSNDIDKVDYSASNGKIIVTAGSSVLKGDGSTDTLIDIEEIQGTDYLDTMTGSSSTDIFKGGASRDSLYGEDGNDTLYGEDGNDLLVGGTGDDELRGGAGEDTVDYSNRVVGINVSLNSGNATAYVDTNSDGISTHTAGEEEDSLYGIENITGSQASDDISGDINNNTINGNSGDDIIDGGAGDDELLGGAGDDIITGGTGDDELLGEDGDDTFVDTSFTGDTIDGGDNTTVGDTIDYHNLSESIKVTLNDTDTSSVNVEVGSDTANHRIKNVENIIGTDELDELTGNSSDNTFEGRNGNDILKGAGGADYLSGGNDNDTLEGGTGNDTLYGDSGDDV